MLDNPDSAAAGDKIYMLNQKRTIVHAFIFSLTVYFWSPDMPFTGQAPGQRCELRVICV
jgi:hypothetical protein